MSWLKTFDFFVEGEADELASDYHSDESGETFDYSDYQDVRNTNTAQAFGKGAAPYGTKQVKVIDSFLMYNRTNYVVHIFLYFSLSLHYRILPTTLTKFAVKKPHGNGYLSAQLTRTKKKMRQEFAAINATLVGLRNPCQYRRLRKRMLPLRIAELTERQEFLEKILKT